MPAVQHFFQGAASNARQASFPSQLSPTDTEHLAIEAPSKLQLEFSPDQSRDWHIPEVGGLLRLAHGLHEDVLHGHIDIRAGKPWRAPAQLIEVGRRQAVRCVPQMHLEHVRPRRRLWQWDVYALHRQAQQRLTCSCADGKRQSFLRLTGVSTRWHDSSIKF